MTSESAPLKGPHARRRFTSHLNKAQAVLTEAVGLAADSMPGEIAYRGNLRTPMFMLQALGRVYRQFDLDNDLFERIRVETKIIEDALGQLDFWAVVSKKTASWSLPPRAQQLARERYVESCGRAWAWVESQNWITSRYHENQEMLGDLFSRKLKKLEWLSPGKESKTLYKWFINELHDNHEEMEELDLSHLELGIHEARRKVRWLSIYMTAVAGGFVLDATASPPADWNQYLTDDIVKNPFNQLPVPENDDQPLKVPAPLLYALSYLIDQLGKIKDRAQWTETASHLLNQTGETANLKELLQQDYLTQETASVQGNELLQQVIVEDQLLLRLADDIER